MNAESEELMPKVIDWIFDGKWAPLDNFYVHPMTVTDWWGNEWLAPTVEHAFQAAKARTYSEYRHVMEAPTPGWAKSRGRAVYLREDWEAGVKLNVMRALLEQKFAYRELAEILLSTGTAQIIEGNTWHDNIWGNCTCSLRKCKKTRGQNLLGQMLMVIRSERRKQLWEGTL